VPSYRDIAFTHVGVAQEHTGTYNIAITRFKVIPLQLPRLGRHLTDFTLLFIINNHGKSL
jgi:hypothetical protein